MKARHSLLLFPLLALGLQPAASAAPVAQWLTAWMPTLDTPDFSGGAVGQRCFGIGCTANGQTISLGGPNQALPDTGAYASAVVAASSPFVVDANAAGQVIFSRQFSLTGADAGWEVTLSGAYSANGLATGASVNSFVTLAASASVRSLPGIAAPTLAGLSLSYKTTLNAAITDPSSLRTGVVAWDPKTGHLDNGVYWVFGTVVAITHVDAAFIASGVGNGGVGGRWALTAVPTAAAVPEPQSWALLLAGAAVVAGVARRRTGLTST